MQATKHTYKKNRVTNNKRDMFSFVIAKIYNAKGLTYFEKCCFFCFLRKLKENKTKQNTHKKKLTEKQKIYGHCPIGSPVLYSDEFRIEWLLYNIIVATYAWGIAMYSTAFPYYLLKNENSESNLENVTPISKNAIFYRNSSNNSVNSHKTPTVNAKMKHINRLVDVISDEFGFRLFMQHLMRCVCVCVCVYGCVLFLLALKIKH